MSLPFHSLRPAFALLTCVALSAGASAQSAAVHTNARPSVRITQKVDTTKPTILPGTHPGAVDQAVIGARLASTTRLANLHLVLSSSDDQIAAFRTLADGQQDKTSPNFHKWMTPDTFGQYFGASSEDIAKITAWMQDQGLTVSSVAKSNRIITFAGSSTAIEKAFHTEMHSVTLANGEKHVSNTTDISVPTALAGVVKGVARLNDIYPTADATRLGTVAERRKAAAAMQVLGGTLKEPLYGGATGTHYIAPGDVATIYNTAPLTTNGIDGTGVTISVLAQSNISLSDVETFRSIFGLPKNDPSVILVGADPGENPDEDEAFLDAEWSGAIATGAKVNFVLSAPDLEDGGVDTSGLYAVDNNVGDIISLSYGGCEYLNTAAGTAFYNTLWEQAAAQGQTVFVSSGDSSANGCASSSSTYASSTYGGYYGVNALGSSAYNVAVGGSTFIDYGPATYWNANGTVVPFSNAISYIPEAPWNNSKIAQANGTYLNSSSNGTNAGNGIAGTGGGISIFTARPSWQTGSGIPTSSDPACTTGTGSTCYASGSGANAPLAGLHRLVPDVVNISANNHDGSLYCADSICSITSTGGLNNAGVVGGTSVATPVQASIQALIDQKNGGRQGNANFFYYRLAQAQYAASTTACQATLGTTANPTVTLPASTCNFHDIVGGSNAVPTSSSDTVGVGFNAAAGYDPASGLGSMNVANVATNWATANFTATTTTLALSPDAPVTHGAAQTISVTVKPTTGTGTPTGDFALIAQTTTPNGPFQYTLTNGSFNGLVSSGNSSATSGRLDGNLAGLPAGNYNVYAQYAGDGNFGGSISNLVPLSIAKEASNVNATAYSFSYNPSNGLFSITTPASFVYGAPVYLDTFVQGASSSGTPIGTVVYSVTRNGVAQASLTTTLDATGNTYFYTGQAIPPYYLNSNYPALSPGSYVITAAYSGDSNFNASTTTNNVTVTQRTPTVTFTAPASLTTGESFTLTYAIANPSTAAFPNTAVLATGNVNFTATGGTSLGTCTLSGATCSLTSNQITASTSILATYTGDTNYASATNTAAVTVGGQTTPTVTVTTSGTLTFGSGIYLVATLNQTAATGTVTFLRNGLPIGSATVTNGVASLLPTAGTIPAGSLPITAVYNGSTTYAAATGAATFTIAKLTRTLTISGPANSIYGQPVMPTTSFAGIPSTYIAPTGGITFTDTTTGTTLGTGAFTFGQSYNYYNANITTTALAAGSHVITAAYAGDTNYNAVTAPAGSLTINVAKLTPAITLTTTTGATSFTTGSGITLEAIIPAGSSQALPAGTLTLTNVTSTATYNGTLSYNAALGAFTASISLNGLTGANSFVVSLTSDSNYNAATSNTLPILIETNNVWVANGNGTVSGLTEAGTPITTTAAAAGGISIAIDNAGDIWSLNKSANSLATISNTGAILSPAHTGGGLNAPTALTIDGAGSVWVTNGTGTLSAFSNSGTPITTTAYTTSFSSPNSINVDSSGNLWITNAGDNSVSEVIGAAAPVTTPTTTAVKNNTLAAKP